MSALIDISGNKYGRLTVIEKSGSRKVKGGTRVTWRCLCECGKEIETDGHSLKSGHSRSCGCLLSDVTIARSRTHGLSRKHPIEYRVWKNVRARCNTPTDSDYHLYGGRGISVCDRWESFANFYADMGARPSQKHSIDRRDTNGNYEPDNCRWATTKEQAQNTRACRHITIDGETKVLNEWARVHKIDRSKVWYRLKVGWSVKQAFGIEPHERARATA